MAFCDRRRILEFRSASWHLRDSRWGWECGARVRVSWCGGGRSSRCLCLYRRVEPDFASRPISRWTLRVAVVSAGGFSLFSVVVCDRQHAAHLVSGAGLRSRSDRELVLWCDPLALAGVARSRGYLLSCSAFCATARARLSLERAGVLASCLF